MKVIFMGTASFAVPALKSIADNYHLTSVFTQKPKKQGRGMSLTKSPVYIEAEKLGVPIYTPSTLKTIEAQQLISSIAADVIVVVAYGLIIPSVMLNIKKYGCLNIHPSILPKFRGAAPLQRTIISGEKKTAVCIIQMDDGIDTGDIIISKIIDLPEEMYLPELHDKCAMLGAELIVKLLNNIDDFHKIPQSKLDASYAHKLSKEEGKIDWNDSADIIMCKIRGMNPWPGTFFECQGKTIKVLKAMIIKQKHQYSSGTVIDNKKFIVACGKDCLELQLVQLAGSKALEAREFLRGYNIPNGTILI